MQIGARIITKLKSYGRKIPVSEIIIMEAREIYNLYDTPLLTDVTGFISTDASKNKLIEHIYNRTSGIAFGQRFVNVSHGPFPEPNTTIAWNGAQLFAMYAPFSMYEIRKQYTTPLVSLDSLLLLRVQNLFNPAHLQATADVFSNFLFYIGESQLFTQLNRSSVFSYRYLIWS